MRFGVHKVFGTQTHSLTDGHTPAPFFSSDAGIKRDHRYFVFNCHKFKCTVL